MSNLLFLKIADIAVTFAFLVYQTYLYQKYQGWKVPVRHKIFSVLFAVAVLRIFAALTLPMPKGRGFLVAAERYRLTSSFLIGRTPS